MTLKTIDEALSCQMASPITPADRIASLDVLRGFALLGILLANIQDFASPTGILHDIPLDVVSQRGAHHALDVAVMIAQWIFIEGKMRALFGLLFGAGTVLLLERINRRAGPEKAADIFYRRNMCLLFFGIIHGCSASTTFTGQRQLFLPINDNYNLFQSKLLLYTGAGRSRG